MEEIVKNNSFFSLSLFFLFSFFMVLLFFQSVEAKQPGDKDKVNSSPLILQEMSWFEVKEYLKSSDMVIIPLGSTEQHGPHLPLGTDYLAAIEISKKISQKTGVLIAPIISVGYSSYHSGFPGTLSLKPETMEQVLFESVEYLLKYGFNRIMFLNFHGGNNIIQSKLILRINHHTKATAIAIGLGSPFQVHEDGEFFDWHAGKGETSAMLYLRPELVKLERAKKPVIRFTPKMKELKKLAEKHPDLMNAWIALIGTPVETGKGGASHQLSSNGVWSFSDPLSASAKAGEKSIQLWIQKAVNFINAWKLAKIK
jgi:creatinine amidohydrolase/Fe(II)-dependent formamide hydrolase-like protein